jgi:hypothetical protein
VTNSFSPFMWPEDEKRTERRLEAVLDTLAVGFPDEGTLKELEVRSNTWMI